ISTYIAEVLRLRDELSDTIFLGEFLDTLEVTVTGSEQVRYATHRNPKTGKRACVLVNQGEEPREATVVFADSSCGRIRICQPFEPVRIQETPASISIPCERLAIVVES
ncbi:MAG: hypothetical protein HY709_10155, partial [Candidatus Latescibacteria bacterium]|nr:hypothetical protein [Candidatus Latescibacterota bacterium]